MKQNYVSTLIKNLLSISIKRGKMYHVLKHKLILSLLIVLWQANMFSQVGINTTTPHQKSVLDIVSKSNNSGVLFPRLTTAEISSVSPVLGDTKVDGLWVYNTDTKCYNYWAGNPENKWHELCGKTIEASSTVLSCSSITISGTLTENIAANNVSFTVPYTLGTGASYASQSINSTGVLGLTASISAGNFANGNGQLVFNISGTPTSTGAAQFAINIGGSSCVVSVPVSSSTRNYSVNCGGTSVNSALQFAKSTVVKTITVSITNATIGTPYAITTNTADEVSYSASGIFTSSSQNIVLQPSGQFKTGGEKTFTVSFDNVTASSCSVKVLVGAENAGSISASRFPLNGGALGAAPSWGSGYGLLSSQSSHLAQNGILGLDIRAGVGTARVYYIYFKNMTNKTISPGSWTYDYKSTSNLKQITDPKDRTGSGTLFAGERISKSIDPYGADLGLEEGSGLAGWFGSGNFWATIPGNVTYLVPEENTTTITVVYQGIRYKYTLKFMNGGNLSDSYYNNYLDTSITLNSMEKV